MVAGVGMMTAAPLGCTLSMSLRKEPSGEPVAPIAASTPAEEKADKKVQPVSRAHAKIEKPEKQKAVVADKGELPPYLADSLLDDASPELIRQPAISGKTVNVFGEFNGRAGKGRLAMDPSLQQVTFPETGYDTSPGVSPTSRAVVFSSTRGGDQAQLFVQRPGSPAVIQLTDAAGESAQPSFSVDGTRIAFSSNRSGNWHLYIMDADGRHLTRVTEGPSQDMHPSFSPDGAKLVYCSLSPASDQWQIWTIDIASGVRKALGRGLFPSWSPDRAHNLIAYQKTRAKGSRWFSLWTVELVDDEPVNQSEIAVSANAALVGPAWSPDGKRLVFSAIVEPAETRNGKPKGEQDVWVCEADGSDRERLTDGNGANLGAWWATDKRIYFVSDRSGQESIWSLPVRSATTADDATTAAAPERHAPGARTREAKPKDAGAAASADPAEVNK